MSLFKKLGLLSILIISSILMLAFTQKASAVPPPAPCLNNTISGTGGNNIVRETANYKLYKLNIKNNSSSLCQYTFKGTPFSGTWTFTFYIDSEMRYPINNDRKFQLSSRSNQNFHIKVTPNASTKITPYNYQLRIQSSNYPGDYEDIFYRITTEQACDARGWECGTALFTCGNNNGLCPSGSGKTCNTARKCVAPTPTPTPLRYNLSVHYVLADKNDNMSKDDNEECFTGEVQLYVGGVFQPWARNSNCKPRKSTTRTNLKTNVRLALPSGSDYTIEGLKFSSDATNHEVRTSRGSASIDVTGDASVYYFIKPKSTTARNTFTYTGYVFIDNGAGGGTAGNGEKDGSEAIFSNAYTVQADSTVDSTRNGTSYSLTRTTAASQVNVRLIVPSGYAATKLNYQLSSGGDTTIRVVDGATKTLDHSGRVNFGIRPTSTPKPKVSVEYILIDGNNNFTKDSGETCEVNIGTILKLDDVAKTWGNRLTTCTPSYTTDNTGSTNVKLQLGSTSSYDIAGLSYWDANSDTPGRFINKPGVNNQTMTRGGNIRFYVKQKTTTEYFITLRSFNDVNDDAKKQASEECKAGAKIKVTQNGTVKTTATTKCPFGSEEFYTSPDAEALINATSPDNFRITGLYIKDKTRTELTPLPNVENALLKEDATVYVGLKQLNNDEPTPTNTPPPSCDRNLPGLEITPPNRNGNPGDEKTYDVKVVNNDKGADCNAVTFVLSKERLPNDNWHGNFDDNTLNNIPKAGGSKSTQFHVKSPNGATEGPKTITVGVRRQGQVNAQKTVNVTYTVQEAESPTPTPAPSGTPTITPTPTPEPTTPTPTTFPGNGLLKVRLGVDGIGKTPRIPIGGNQNPIDPNKNFTLALYSTSSNTRIEGWDNWTFTYNSESQKFENELALSNDFPTDTYNVYLEGAGYIRARYPGSATITKGQTTVIDSDNFYVITGNLNNEDTSENIIDIMDYMVLTSCYIYSQDYSLCDQNPNNKVLSDLNSDGIINEDDYTLFLKEYGNEGAPLP